MDTFKYKANHIIDSLPSNYLHLCTLLKTITNLRAHLVAWVQQEEEVGLVVLWRLSHDWMPHPLLHFP